MLETKIFERWHRMACLADVRQAEPDGPRGEEVAAEWMEPVPLWRCSSIQTALLLSTSAAMRALEASARHAMRCHLSNCMNLYFYLQRSQQVFKSFFFSFSKNHQTMSIRSKISTIILSRCCQVWPAVARCDQQLPGVTSWCQVWITFEMCDQMVSDVTRCLKSLPAVTRCDQHVSSPPPISEPYLSFIYRADGVDGPQEMERS